MGSLLETLFKEGVLAMLSAQQLSEIQSRLLQEKKELNQHLEDNENFGFNQDFVHGSMGELSSYDNHPADDATELYEREKDIALREHYKLQLRNIDHALETIDNGKYGKCEVCGRDIPAERLEALPTTVYCKEHSPDQVVSHKRPIEEGVLMPDFGKFDLDEKHENVAYDAEDTWQEVAEFGTSETPSDLAYPNGQYNDIYDESGENIGYVEDYENFVGTDMYGNNITVYPNPQHEKYEQSLDEEGIMTSYGDLPGYEHDAYVDND